MFSQTRFCFFPCAFAVSVYEFICYLVLLAIKNGFRSMSIVCDAFLYVLQNVNVLIILSFHHNIYMICFQIYMR